MPNVLVDTSVWVDFFRHGESPASRELDHLLEEGQAVLCGIVELELLQGLRASDKPFLTELISGLPYIETIREDFQKSGEILGALRAKGFQIPATDGLIATLCLRHDLSLLTLDRHFNNFHGLKKIKI
jgi:predicted nucleic acid-binding protein